MDQLTVSQAIELGYEYFLFQDQEWQHLKELQHISEEDIKRGCTLATIEVFYPGVPDKEEILEMIADRVTSDHYDETSSDDMVDLYKSIKAIQLGDDIITALEAAVTTSQYRKDTGIKIIKR